MTNDTLNDSEALTAAVTELMDTAPPAEACEAVACWAATQDAWSDNQRRAFSAAMRRAADVARKADAWAFGE